MTTHDEPTKNTSDTDASQNQELNNSSNELQQCNAELAEWKDKYLHLAADFQNYKKRLVKDRANWELNTQIKLFLPLIAILDDFDRAFAQEKKAQEEQELSQLIIGFGMIAKELHKVLAGFGVTPIEQYSTFDPAYHEAISQVASENHKSGEVVEVLQKGYLLNDIVLRPAKVVVAE